MHECTQKHGDIPVLSAILDALDEGLLIISPDNQVVCINRYLQRFLGINQGAPRGTDADLFIRRDLLPRICEESRREEILRFLSGNFETVEFSCTLRSSNGRGRTGPLFVPDRVWRAAPGNAPYPPLPRLAPFWRYRLRA